MYIFMYMFMYTPVHTLGILSVIASLEHPLGLPQCL